MTETSLIRLCVISVTVFPAARREPRRR